MSGTPTVVPQIFRANNYRLFRAVSTALDQTYSPVEPGYYLQPFDNTRTGRIQPYATPEGFVVKDVVFDASTNLKVVVYKNDQTNEVLVVPMGTNGDGDTKGWVANLRSFGREQLWQGENSNNLLSS